MKKDDDPPLTALGHQMALKTGEYLKEQLEMMKHEKKCSENAKVVLITSPFYRCLQTSKMIALGLGIDNIQNQDLLVEDAIEEWFVLTCGVKQDTRTTRNFSNLTDELRKELFLELRPVSNSFFDYTNKPKLRAKYQESFFASVERFSAIYDIMTSLDTPDKVYVLVSHGISVEATQDLVPKYRFPGYCAVNLVVKDFEKCEKNKPKYKMAVQNHYAWSHPKTNPLF